MARPRGIHVPKPVFEHIVAAIASLERADFSVAELCDMLPHVQRGSISCFLKMRRKSGWLERTGRGQYRIGGIRIKTRLPDALVAEAVWAVLYTSCDRRPARLVEIVGEAESYIGRPGISVYSAVSHALSYWHRDGFLERTGQRGEYAYRVKVGVAERPVLRARY